MSTPATLNARKLNQNHDFSILKSIIWQKSYIVTAQTVWLLLLCELYCWSTSYLLTFRSIRVWSWTRQFPVVEGILGVRAPVNAVHQLLARCLHHRSVLWSENQEIPGQLRRGMYSQTTDVAVCSPATRAVLDLFFQSSRSRIWNDISGRRRIFKLNVILLILMCETLRVI